MKKIRIIKAEQGAWYYNLVGVELNILPLRHIRLSDAVGIPLAVFHLILVLEANGMNYFVNANDVEYSE